MPIEYKNINDLVIDLLDKVQEMADLPSFNEQKEALVLPGLSTGFIDLDRVTNGLKPGELILVAARPGGGRTSFVLNIAEHLLLNQEVPVMLFSYSTSASEVTQRMVSSCGRISYRNLVTGQLMDEEWSRLMLTIERIRHVIVEINDDVALDFESLLDNATEFVERHGGKGVIIIDGLLWIDGIERMSSADRWTRIDQNARALKTLARKLDIPIIVSSQLKAGDEKFERRIDRRPTMHDLYGSATLAEIADTILLIYRDELVNHASRELGVAEIIIDKSTLKTGTVKLAFLSACFRFESMARIADYL